MWRRLKREIVSLDLVGNDISLVRFDLNHERIPDKLKEHFDFVTNCGTTEHVFNQANCFEVMHDLTKLNGIMAHSVPFAGYDNHGLFKYTIKFFTRIAKANHYDCLDAWLPVDSKARKLRPDLTTFFRDDAKMFRNARLSTYHPIDFYNLTYGDYRSADECIYVFLRKTVHAEFQFPTDLAD
jgi:2-polyprenyl-3-methyl-5-hydroxy-6-metoxy-1,4-benzoquinol methylase